MATTHRQRLLHLQADLRALRPHETLPLAERLQHDPALAMQLGGLAPDPWQADLLRSRWSRALLLASRQIGKSQVASAVALHQVLSRPRSLVLLLSPTLRQSGELFRDKLLPLWRTMGRPLLDRPPTQLTLELANGSPIISLPESEGGIRGYSGVHLLVVDEAARVSDDLYRAVRPMLAVSHGRLLAMSTPFGRRGWFHEEWQSARTWKRVKIRAAECPRISRQFLAEERSSLGERWYRQEYCCSFEDVVGAVFTHEEIQACMTDDVEPLFPITATPGPDAGDDDLEPLFAGGEL